MICGINRPPLVTSGALESLKTYSEHPIPISQHELLRHYS
jgi:hypothetical protein